MSDFELWFIMGVEHIVNWQGYDHIMFVALLVFAFPISEWKKLILLITAFTIGHSLSLGISVLVNYNAPRALTEFLIAFTILFSSVYQLVITRNENQKSKWILYLMVLFFGLIHGLGFSFMLRSVLGRANDVIQPLLYFNLGIELGQLLIVALVILFSLLLTRLFNWPFKSYKQITVCIIAITALVLCALRLQELF